MDIITIVMISFYYRKKMTFKKAIELFCLILYILSYKLYVSLKTFAKITKMFFKNILYKLFISIFVVYLICNKFISHKEGQFLTVLKAGIISFMTLQIILMQSKTTFLNQILNTKDNYDIF